MMSGAIQIVCPHCGTVNRVPQGKLGDKPKCGQCRQRLFDGKPHDVSGDAFRRHVSRDGIPVVIDFWAAWCGPCRMMAPEFERAAGQLDGTARLLKLDTERESQLSGQLGIRSIPTTVIFVGGREVARQPGAMRAADIVRFVEEHAGVG